MKLRECERKDSCPHHAQTREGVGIHNVDLILFCMFEEQDFSW